MCHIILSTKEADRRYLLLKKGGAEISTGSAGRELTEYFIIDSSPSMSVEENGTVILFNVVFKRRLTNVALMTFLPSMLLIAISYSTSYFRLPNFFNTAITVNLTVMLTTTNLLISVTTKLAQTSYIKWMEAWLIFAQLVPFIQVQGLKSKICF